MKYRVADIRPNPFRHIDRYPIRADKVAALRESYHSTGFWGNIVGRVRDGKPEIAYGHHRLAALKAEYGGREEVELIIRKLSDEQMLQIMARENMEEWGTSAAVEQETVRAVVEAYGDGLIELAAPAARAEVRYAPSFVPGEESRVARREVRPYTVQAVADFLGWVRPDGRAQDKVGDALSALQFIEEGVLRERDFDGLSTKDAQAVVAQARQARAVEQRLAAEAERRAKQAEAEVKRARKERAAAERREREARTAREAEKANRERLQAQENARQAEARRKQQEAEARKLRERGRSRASTAGTAVGSALRRGEVGYRQAREVAHKALPREKKVPDIDPFVDKLLVSLNGVFAEGDPQRVKVEEVIKYRGHESFDQRRRQRLVQMLLKVAGRFESAADRLEAEQRTTRPALTR